MKNEILKLTTFALLTGLAFSSRSAVITLSVEGSVSAVDGISGQEQNYVSGGTGVAFESPVKVQNFSIDAAVPDIIFEEGPELLPEQFDDEFPQEVPNEIVEEQPFPFLSSASASSRANQQGNFGLSSFSFGYSEASSSVTQTYVVTNGNFAANYFFNFKIEEGFLSADCAGFNFFDLPSEIACGFGQSSNYATSFFSAAIEIQRSNGGINELFRSEVRITSDGGYGSGVIKSIVDSGTDKIGAEVNYSGSGSSAVAYEIAPELKTISIGELLADETVTLTYRINTSTFTYSELNPNEANNAPFAGVNFGDPSGFNARFPTSSSITVSAPGNLLILGLGISALAFARKRKAKQ